MFICNECHHNFRTPLIRKKKPVAEDIEICPYCGSKDFKEIPCCDSPSKGKCEQCRETDSSGNLKGQIN